MFIQDETDEQQRDRMYTEVGELCRKWRLEGIEPVMIGMRLLAMALAAAEACGASCETVCECAVTFYGLNKPTVPVAKA